MPRGLFTVKGRYDQAVREYAFGLGLPEVRRVAHREPAYRAVALLDGAVSDVGQYGFGGRPAGIRVIGFHAMRYLCLVLEAAPPKRTLLGETVVPTEQQLRDELRDFLFSPPDLFRSQAAKGLLADLFSVRDLLGDAMLPAPNDEPEQAWYPALGTWGDQGFTRYAARTLQDAGVPVEEAVQVRELVFSDEPFYNPRHLGEWDTPYLIDACCVGMAALQKWIDTTIPLKFVADLVDLGVTPEDARLVRDSRGLTGFELFDWLRRDPKYGWTDADAAARREAQGRFPFRLRPPTPGTAPRAVQPGMASPAVGTTAADDAKWEEVAAQLAARLATLAPGASLGLDYRDPRPRRPYAQATANADGFVCRIVSAHHLPHSIWPIDEAALVEANWSPPNETTHQWTRQAADTDQAAHLLLFGLRDGRACPHPHRVTWS
jgi:hypothetical protein